MENLAAVLTYALATVATVQALGLGAGLVVFIRTKHREVGARPVELAERQQALADRQFAFQERQYDENRADRQRQIEDVKAKREAENERMSRIMSAVDPADLTPRIRRG